ncbi:hypothetical protein [Kitasatospora cineracea]|uniref:hypothetical protein n=1 Tax=Kitasatospora cineracea TaxID=88074 RepID=UPI0036B6C3D5
MTATQPFRVSAAVATSTGSSGVTGDAFYLHTLRDGTVAACVVDGVGHSPQITTRAAFLAQVAARVGATRGPVLGLLAAADTISDPGPKEHPEEDAVAAIAVVRPDRPEVSVAWAGDCAVWGMTPATGKVSCLTTDQTMGRFLRTVNPGGPAALAAHHDPWIRVSLARSSTATVKEAEGRAPLILLTTDGVHQSLGPRRLASVARPLCHSSPQDLADGLLRAALARARRQVCEIDDATVLALALPSAPRRPPRLLGHAV